MGRRGSLILLLRRRGFCLGFFYLVAYASDWEMYMGWVEGGLDGFHCVGFG